VSAKTRVQKFRESLRRHNCGRLDVWIGGEWIMGARTIARVAGTTAVANRSGRSQGLCCAKCSYHQTHQGS
jgi:hypothetical protein